ncbi:MAG: pitrilysin family protein [Pyrinomonadaceae bacterium]
MIEHIKSTTLDNGAIVLTEFMPGLRSVTVGIWVRSGSRHEAGPLNGMCHFIEHAVFKGTRRRSALDIAVESDRLGGHFDAYTSHELTGFTMKVVDHALPQAFDLLADLLAFPRFDEEDLEREQKVIIEEMKMVEDTPDEFLAEIYSAACFPGHALGRPIEGTADTVSNFDARTTAAFHARAYQPRNLVIAAAGNLEHDALVRLAEKAFADFASANEAQQPEEAPRLASPIMIQRKKELEQAHLILSAPWPSAKSDDRYAASLLVSVLGGGTSSRLWQSVREERGLAYSVGAAASPFTDIGVFQLYAGTSPDQLDDVLELSLAELRRVVRESVDAEELRLVKDQAISSILLGLESSGARASALARQEIIHGRRIDPEYVIRRIEQVTPDDLQRIARACFTTESLGVGALGDLNGFGVDRARLEI